MKRIITISREFGSGGRVIGRTIAENLGFDFYDREIIDMAAKESGLAAEFIERTEQSLSSGWLYNLLLGTSYAGQSVGAGTQQLGAHTLPLADQVFNAERKIILSLVGSPCVIVGRCADYILRNCGDVPDGDLLNLFIYADLDAKVARAVSHYNIPEKDARKTVQQVDKRRANHYNTFTDDVWGDRKNYDLLVNSSTLGIERTAQMLTEFIRLT